MSSKTNTASTMPINGTWRRILISLKLQNGIWTIMEMPAKRVMPKAHQCTPGKRSMLWLTQIRPTINAAAVGLGTPINHRLSTLPMSVLKRARRRAAQAQ